MCMTVNKRRIKTSWTLQWGALQLTTQQHNNNTMIGGIVDLGMGQVQIQNFVNRGEFAVYALIRLGSSADDCTFV